MFAERGTRWIRVLCSARRRVTHQLQGALLTCQSGGARRLRPRFRSSSQSCEGAGLPRVYLFSYLFTYPVFKRSLLGLESFVSCGRSPARAQPCTRRPVPTSAFALQPQPGASASARSVSVGL